MSSLLSADDLNDFIRPSVACIKPVEDLRKKESPTHFELEFENPDKTEIEVEIGTNGDVIEVNKSKQSKKKLETAQISLADCLACSGCITSSEEVLISQHSFQEFVNFWKEHNDDNNIHYVLNLSPQARASLANAFDVDVFMMDKVLYKIFKTYYGFEYAVSTNIGRRLAHDRLFKEIRDRKESGDGKNLLASICPGWVLYVEKTHPYLLDRLSRVRSPQYITARLIKELLKKEKGYEFDQVYNLSIMPCFDKKLEASRDSDIVNCVITPKEFVSMIQEDERIDISKLIEEEQELAVSNNNNNMDEYLKIIESITPKGWYSGDLYGWCESSEDREGDESGGYARVYLEYYKREHGLNDQNSEIRIIKGRNEDIYEMHLIDKCKNDEVICKSGVINGFKNIQNLVRKLKDGNDGKKGRGLLLNSRRRGVVSRRGNDGPSVDLTKCEFVEVMACPSGCINGGGQIAAPIGVEGKEWVQASVGKYHSASSVGDGDSADGESERAEWAEKVLGGDSGDSGDSGDVEGAVFGPAHVPAAAVAESGGPDDANAANAAEAAQLGSAW